MENPIGLLYEKFDAAIMFGINKGVRLWNWTTGGTKKDLSDHLLIASPILELLGGFMRDPIHGIAYGIVSPVVSYGRSQMNKELEFKENEALRQGLKLDPSEYYNQKVYGPAFFLLGGFISPNDLEITGIGHCVRGLSYYVMRADSLPPRKSAFVRLKEKLSEKREEAYAFSFISESVRGNERLENLF